MKVEQLSTSIAASKPTGVSNLLGSLEPEVTEALYNYTRHDFSKTRNVYTMANNLKHEA